MDNLIHKPNEWGRFKMSKIEKVTLTLKNGVKTKNLDEWQQNSNQYTATLKYQGRQLTVDFFTGLAWKRDPNALDVLSNLALTASHVEYCSSHEDFCEEIGYSPSFQTQKMFKDCLRINRRLKKLLGDDYEEISEIASRH